MSALVLHHGLMPGHHERGKNFYSRCLAGHKQVYNIPYSVSSIMDEDRLSNRRACSVESIGSGAKAANMSHQVLGQRVLAKV